MYFQRLLSIFAQFFVFFGALCVGVLGAFKVDLFQQLLPRSYIRYVQGTIGLAALYMILCRFI